MLVTTRNARYNRGWSWSTVFERKIWNIRNSWRKIQILWTVTRKIRYRKISINQSWCFEYILSTEIWLSIYIYIDFLLQSLEQIWSQMKCWRMYGYVPWVISGMFPLLKKGVTDRVSCHIIVVAHLHMPLSSIRRGVSFNGARYTSQYSAVEDE